MKLPKILFICLLFSNFFIYGTTFITEIVNNTDECLHFWFAGCTAIQEVILYFPDNKTKGFFKPIQTPSGIVIASKRKKRICNAYIPVAKDNFCIGNSISVCTHDHVHDRFTLLYQRANYIYKLSRDKIIDKDLLRYRTDPSDFYEEKLKETREDDCFSLIINQISDEVFVMSPKEHKDRRLIINEKAFEFKFEKNEFLPLSNQYH